VLTMAFVACGKGTQRHADRSVARQEFCDPLAHEVVYGAALLTIDFQNCYED